MVIKLITLKIGEKAPDFNLKDQNGNSVSLSSFKGKKVILYFYPKDDTPGCTKEACDFKDNIDQLKKNGVVVIGISSDDEQSHRKFVDKYSLPFILVSDVDKEVSKKYGVYELKEKFGRQYFGITRSTFLIDETGKIKNIYYRVNPDNHVKEIIDEIRGG